MRWAVFNRTALHPYRHEGPFGAMNDPLPFACQMGQVRPWSGPRKALWRDRMRFDIIHKPNHTRAMCAEPNGPSLAKPDF